MAMGKSINRGLQFLITGSISLFAGRSAIDLTCDHAPTLVAGEFDTSDGISAWPSEKQRQTAVTRLRDCARAASRPGGEG